MSLLSDAIAPFEASISKNIVADLVAHKDEVVNELNKLETSAIDALTDHIVAALPAHGLLAAISGPVATAVKAHETELIAALGGPNEALFALVLHEAESLPETGLV